jgi:hypothetical protein
VNLTINISSVFMGHSVDNALQCWQPDSTPIEEKRQSTKHAFWVRFGSFTLDIIQSQCIQTFMYYTKEIIYTLQKVALMSEPSKTLP